MAFPNDSTVFCVSFIKFKVSFSRELGREAKWRSEVASWATGRVQFFVKFRFSFVSCTTNMACTNVQYVILNVHLTFGGDFYGVLMKYLSKTKSPCAIESSLSWARKIAKKFVLRVWTLTKWLKVITSVLLSVNLIFEEVFSEIEENICRKNPARRSQRSRTFSHPRGENLNFFIARKPQAKCSCSKHFWCS